MFSRLIRGQKNFPEALHVCSLLKMCSEKHSHGESNVFCLLGTATRPLGHFSPTQQVPLKAGWRSQANCLWTRESSVVTGTEAGWRGGHSSRSVTLFPGTTHFPAKWNRQNIMKAYYVLDSDDVLMKLCHYTSGLEAQPLYFKILTWVKHWIEEQFSAWVSTNSKVG